MKRKHLLEAKAELQAVANSNQQAVAKFMAHASTLVDRLAAFGSMSQFTGDRDLFTVYGYKKTLDAQDYLAEYKRHDIAARIVEAFPSATWITAPMVRDVDQKDAENPTGWDEEWLSITERIPVFHYLERADLLACLGRYGVLVLGVNDGKTSLDLPLDTVSGADKLLWLRPFGEYAVTIDKLVEDPMSPFFGMPEYYQIKMGDGRSVNSEKDVKVHHTRVIHIAEGLLDNDIFGLPRLERGMNRLYDLAKIPGGSAELFWKNGRGVMVGSAKPDAQFTDDDVSSMSSAIDDLQHQLRNWILTKGMDITPFQLAVPDPTGHFNIQIELLSAAYGIPKRILMGSERGELASGQDEVAWKERIQERRTKHAEPRILHAFIDRLIKVGILSEPKNGYLAEWDKTEQLSVKDQAAVNLTRAQILHTLQPTDPTAGVGQRELRELAMLPEELPDDLLSDPFDDEGEEEPEEVPAAGKKDDEDPV
jgi:hypothetical protein